MVKSKARLIEELNSEIHSCKECELAETRQHSVPGEGNLDPRISLVAQAPGEAEDEEGRMFVGRSGDILDHLLEAAGINREKLYMTNLVKCFLPGYRRPRRDEIDPCSRYLDREMEIVNPEIVVPLGYYPARYLLKNSGISVPEDKGEIFSRIWYNGGRKIFPLGHPAAIVYDYSLKKKMESDYSKLAVLSRNCKWYRSCPMKRFTDRGLLEKKWTETYCKGDWANCERYKQEKNGTPHPDYMLPDGRISEELKRSIKK